MESWVWDMRFQFWTIGLPQTCLHCWCVSCCSETIGFLFLSSIRCKNGMNHLRDRVPHLADGLCQYVHQYNNKVLICKVRLTRHQLGPSSLCQLFGFCTGCCMLRQIPDPFSNHFWSYLTKNNTQYNCLYVFYINFSFWLSYVSRSVMREAERWLFCPRRQLPLITHGLDWPSMRGQGT